MKYLQWAIFLGLMIVFILPMRGGSDEERIKGFTGDRLEKERQMEAALKKMADPKVYEKHLEISDGRAPHRRHRTEL